MNPLRRSCFAVICAALFTLGAFAADPEELMAQANVAYAAKDCAKAAQLFEQAIAAGATGPSAPYNGACCYALAGKADQAFALLDKSIEAGWHNLDHLKSDDDFKSLHDDPRWAKAVKKCEDAVAEFVKTLKEPALREELLKRVKEDQRVRLDPNVKVDEMLKIDADNTAYMKKVIEKHGWPGKSMVGDDGAQAAFLMVQHVAGDLPFSKKCLELMTKAVEEKEARKADWAYLTDRVRMFEAKPQRYGTQFTTINGELKLHPIEDEANVDARRKEVGLGPLAEYVKMVQAMQKK